MQKKSRRFHSLRLEFFITQINFEGKKISPPTVEKISEPPQMKYADSVKILFYLNGVLTENYGEVSGIIFIENYQNWRRIKNKKFGGEYFLFPKNFTAKDLITPRITIYILKDQL